MSLSLAGLLGLTSLDLSLDVHFKSSMLTELNLGYSIIWGKGQLI